MLEIQDVEIKQQYIKNVKQLKHKFYFMTPKDDSMILS